MIQSDRLNLDAGHSANELLTHLRRFLLQTLTSVRCRGRGTLEFEDVVFG